MLKVKQVKYQSASLYLCTHNCKDAYWTLLIAQKKELLKHKEQAFKNRDMD